MKHTLVVPNRLAWREARFQAAREGASGMLIMTLDQLAGRLAGGFLQEITRQTLQSLVTEALRKGGFEDIGAIADLPGMVRAVINTLRKAWRADIDLQSRSRESRRIADLALIERRIIEGLPPGMKLPRDLRTAAIIRTANAPRVTGPLTFKGFWDVDPCWRPLISALAAQVPMEWHRIASIQEDLSWLEEVGVKIVNLKPTAPKHSAVLCANPQHEVLEALRWARQLIATGQAGPGDIAVVATTVEDWDEHLWALEADSQLPIHFVHGRRAISTFPGQQAAALAEVLLRGLSKDRMIRVIRLCRVSLKNLESLPDDWHHALPKDAPLLHLSQWHHALEEADKAGWPDDVDQRPILAPLLELLADGPRVAKEAGEAMLSGQALVLWQQALLDGPPEALATTLVDLRVDDGCEPAASILWGPSVSLPPVPRRFVRLLGLTSRSWPRTNAEDSLLPDYVLPASELTPVPLATQDRRDFLRILHTTSKEVVFSRSRRDREGRLLGASPLLPKNIEQQYMERARIPEHAVSEADRLLARPEEFAGSPLSVSTRTCWQDWRKPEVTRHDGLIAPNHPVIQKAVSGVQSATSLKKLLRDPLGFVWSYALSWREPTEIEEPLVLDPPTFGGLVHKILERAVVRLEQETGGFARADEDSIIKAINDAALEIAGDYELKLPIPPRVLWLRTLQSAREMAHKALKMEELQLSGQQSWVELPFGLKTSTFSAHKLPWDPGRPVTIPEVEMQINGKIDRLDMDAARKSARVSDYKTGKVPKDIDSLQLKGGAELQRCLYSFAVKALIPQVEGIEARLLYPAEGGGIYPIPDPDDTLRTLIHYLQVSRDKMRSGLAVIGKDTIDRYNDLRFALPSNAAGFYLTIKLEPCTEALGELANLWELP